MKHLLTGSMTLKDGLYRVIDGRLYHVIAEVTTQEPEEVEPRTYSYDEIHRIPGVWRPKHNPLPCLWTDGKGEVRYLATFGVHDLDERNNPTFKARLINASRSWDGNDFIKMSYRVTHGPGFLEATFTKELTNI